MTNEEKELLYEEFKERLEKENKSKQAGKGTRKLKQMRFLSKAREHFNERRDYYIHNLRKIEGGHVVSNECLIAYGWDSIRHLVCWTYGVCVIEDLPDDKQEEINQYTIELIDKLFDKFSEES